MSYQRNNNQKTNSGSNSVSEAVALSKGLSFPAVPALQMQGAEVAIQMKKIPAQLMEEEEPLQGKFEPIQKVEEEEPLQGKFQTIQRVEEEEPLQGKFETIQRVEEEVPLQGKFETIQRVEEEEPLQGKFETIQKVEEEEPLQGKFETVQRVEEEEPLQGKFETIQKVEEEEPLQGKFETIQRVEEEEPLQGKFETVQRVEEEEPLQGKFETIQKVEVPKNTNQNGLPGNLKSGIEQLSGYSMDDVKVHYNSSQPAQLQALAYAQGTDIHIAPGQEKHLPHEAWHVAQQKQGRVKPTLQMKTGVPVNDDAGLENEADVMGQKAKSVGIHTAIGSETGVTQRIEKEVIQGKFAEGNLIQLFKAQPIQLEGEEAPAEAPQQNAKGKAAAVWTDLREQVGLMREGKTTTSKVGATLARKIGSEASDELYNTIKKLEALPGAKELSNQKKIGELKELMQLNKGVGEKYNELIGGPETFMSQEEMDLHLNLFKTGGAHAFITDFNHKNINGDWNGWGIDRNFVSTLPRGNELVEEAQKEKGIITLEQKLGIREGEWVKLCPRGIIWRYIIEPDKIEKAGLSMAHGKESGAYSDLWIAGGETKGGAKEATIGIFKGEQFRQALKDVIKIEPLDLSEQTPVKTMTMEEFEKEPNFQDFIPERYREKGGGFGG